MVRIFDNDKGDEQTARDVEGVKMIVDISYSSAIPDQGLAWPPCRVSAIHVGRIEADHSVTLLSL